MAHTDQYELFETAGGCCGIAWHEFTIIGFQLPASSKDATERNLLRRLPCAVRGTAPQPIAQTMEAARQYFQGENVDFSPVLLDLSRENLLFQQIYAAARRVVWGQTTTYGTLAKAIGAGPEIAREVGRAMAKNPIPLIIPCHRVLAAGGKVGGFSAPGGSASKLRMLQLEGIGIGPPPSPQQSLGF